jgi:hypothetical protein
MRLCSLISFDSTADTAVAAVISTTARVLDVAHRPGRSQFRTIVSFSQRRMGQQPAGVIGPLPGRLVVVGAVGDPEHPMVGPGGLVEQLADLGVPLIHAFGLLALAGVDLSPGSCGWPQPGATAVEHSIEPNVGWEGRIRKLGDLHDLVMPESKGSSHQ